MKIYFDDVLINEDAYAGIENEYQLFTDAFYLGSVSANVFKIKIAKSYVGDLPTIVKIEDDNTEFILNVDSIEEDKGFYNFTLTDKMVNFNFNYDASGLISTNEKNEEETYLQDIFEDICSQAGIETDYELNIVNNIEVSWYDNTIQAREYISYIAELEGGFAYVNEDDKLDIKPHKTASKKTISSDEVSELILGERKFVNRVVYDNGAGTYYSFDINDDNEEEDPYLDGITVYLNTENPYIVNEEQVEYVFEKIKEFEFWTLKVPNSRIDTNIRAGDIITFTHEGSNYETIAQYTSSYGGGWVGSYELAIESERRQETQVIGQEERIKALKTIIDRANAELSIIANETAGNTSSISELNINVEGINSEVEKIDPLEERISTIEQTTDGIEFKINKVGGQNQVINSVGQYGIDFWETPHDVIDSSSPHHDDVFNNSLSTSGWLFKEKTPDGVPRLHRQVINAPAGTYTINAKFKKLLENAEVLFWVNGLPYNIENADGYALNEWVYIEYTFETSSSGIEIKFTTDADDSCLMTDLMLNGESIAFVWQPANGESILGNTRIGIRGVEVGDKAKENVGLTDTGLRIYYGDEEVGRSTATGMRTDKYEGQEFDIGNVMLKDMGDQTWLTRR